VQMRFIKRYTAHPEEDDDDDAEIGTIVA
jgi:hypothetical protein